jgi:oligopeptide/dipeptide ABC transporter ATP-binding protein
MQLLPVSKGTHISGEALFESKSTKQVDLISLTAEGIRKYRGSDIAMIFQEPMTSLNPVFTCGNQVAEAIKLHQKVSSKEAKVKTIELFKKVKLPRPEQMFDAYPHQLSGGQKQRVMIAMAISCNPKVLIADEPTTALDVTVQHTILQLLKELQLKYDMAMIFITHDLGIVKDIADEIVVMRHGEVMESGLAHDILNSPQHPYTKALLSSVPSMDPDNRTDEPPLAGDPPNPINPPSGCRFHTRCAQAQPVCSTKMPPLVSSKDGQGVACWIHVENSGHSQAVSTQQAVSNNQGAA